MRNLLLRGFVLLAIVAGVLGGIIWLGRQALDQLHAQGGHKIRLTDIQCDPPFGMNRGDFLDEIQYLSGLPAELNLQEDGLPRRLADAFAQHPWVATVEGVQVLPTGVVRVQLKHRIPVLAISWDGQMRAVDAAGILLPANASTLGLPVFDGTPQPPGGPAGTPWKDAAIRTAAKNAANK
jgi:hypothetical protein